MLRRVEHSLATQIIVSWTLSGTQRFTPPGEHIGRGGRALIGFHDGLSNLNPSDVEDAALIFVDPAAVATYPPTPVAGPQNPQPGQSGYNPDPVNNTVPSFPTILRPAPTNEPAWTTDGSYMFIRGSILNTPQWDQATPQVQEETVGRFKSSGAFLDVEDTSANRDSLPQFATSPINLAVPSNPHHPLPPSPARAQPPRPSQAPSAVLAPAGC